MDNSSRRKIYIRSNEVSLEIKKNPSKPAWHQFQFEPAPLRRPQPLRYASYEGWDSETYQGDHYGDDNGKAFLICNTKDALVCHDNLDEILRFFTETRKNINVWWYIDYDVRTIFKWHMPTLEALYPENNAIGEATFNEYKLTYLRKKMLVVRNTHSHRTTRFYDAMLFYRQPLETAARRYLQREPPNMKAHRSEDLGAIFHAEPQSVIDYCMWDATATQDLMMLFYSRLATLQFFPKRPISSGYLAQDYIRTFSDYPQIFNVPSYVNRAAWSSFRGGWVDIWKRGTMNVWKYDINSAYPRVMHMLPDIRDGRWVHEYVAESPMGFSRCTVKQNWTSITALAAWFKQSHIYPTYDEPSTMWLCKQEFDALRKCDGITLEADLHYYFIPNANHRTPFRHFVETLVRFKNDSHPKRGNKPDEAAYLAAKELVNSGYGKTCERVPIGEGKYRPGKLFMPAYASTITGAARALMIPWVAKHLNDIVTIATDCLTSTKPINVPLDDWESGKWKIEAEDTPGTFVFPGIYQIGNEITHSRGFRIATCACTHASKMHSPKCRECKCLQFSSSLVKMLDTQEETLTIRYDRPGSVRESIRQSDQAMIGVFAEKRLDKTLDLPRRLWTSKPSTFRDLLTEKYESIPIPYSLCTS